MATILVFMTLGIFPRTATLVALSYGNKYSSRRNSRGANMWQPKVGCGNSLLQPKKI